MELGFLKIIDGLKLMVRSITLTTVHPVLLVYLVSNFITILVASLFIADIQAISLYDIRGWILNDYANPLIGISIKMYITLFFLSCLAHHAMHLMKKETHGLKDTIKDVVTNLPKLSLWFVFVIAMYFCVDALMHSPMSVIIAVSFIVIAIISWATGLVLPIIAIQKQADIVAAIKLSDHLVYKHFLVFISLFLIFNIINIVKPGGILLELIIQHLMILTYTVFYYEYYVRIKAA